MDRRALVLLLILAFALVVGIAMRQPAAQALAMTTGPVRYLGVSVADGTAYEVRLDPLGVPALQCEGVCSPGARWFLRYVREYVQAIGCPNTAADSERSLK